MRVCEGEGEEEGEGEWSVCVREREWSVCVRVCECEGGGKCGKHGGNGCLSFQKLLRACVCLLWKQLGVSISQLSVLLLPPACSVWCVVDIGVVYTHAKIRMKQEQEAHKAVSSG